MKKTVLAVILMTANICVYAQDDNQVKVELHGFVNNEVMYDTRQVTYAREGEVAIFPKPEVPDVNGVDKNAQGELSMFNFHSRLSVGISGPKIGKYNTNALIEGDFLGSVNESPNVLRLRHAYMKLTATKHEWLIGQYWHMMFVPECFPDIVGWNVGLPVHILNRAPQIRYSYMPSAKIRINAAILSQRDFVSHGPKSNLDDTNTGSSTYLKRSGLPDMQVQLLAQPTSKLTMGATGGYKVITPRIETSKGYSVNETLGSYNLNVFTRYKTAKTTIMVEGIVGQNLSHYVMLGGYGVKSEDPITNERTYTNIQTVSLWTDISHMITPKIKVGIFAGYVINNGSSDVTTTAKPITYGLGTDNIASVLSISPRITYSVKRLKLGFEVNNLTAAYGSIQNDLKVTNTKDVTNNRFLFSTSYSF